MHGTINAKRAGVTTTGACVLIGLVGLAGTAGFGLLGSAFAGDLAGDADARMPHATGGARSSSSIAADGLANPPSELAKIGAAFRAPAARTARALVTLGAVSQSGQASLAGVASSAARTTRRPSELLSLARATLLKAERQMRAPAADVEIALRSANLSAHSGSSGPEFWGAVRANARAYGELLDRAKIDLDARVHESVFRTERWRKTESDRYIASTRYPDALREYLNTPNYSAKRGNMRTRYRGIQNEANAYWAIRMSYPPDVARLNLEHKELEHARALATRNERIAGAAIELDGLLGQADAFGRNLENLPVEDLGVLLDQLTL